MTNVVNLPQVGILDLAPTHSKHANMTYQQLLHLHCIQSGLLAKATELLLAQGVNLLHSSQDCLQAIKLLLPPFYPNVISFTRPSSPLIFFGEGSTAREEGLGTRLIPGHCKINVFFFFHNSQPLLQKHRLCPGHQTPSLLVCMRDDLYPQEVTQSASA